jgi:hypothetical protein
MNNLRFAKTKENRCNDSHVEAVYDYVCSKLTPFELSHLCDKLVWDKHYMIKTVKLIGIDLETITSDNQ